MKLKRKVTQKIKIINKTKTEGKQVRKMFQVGFRFVLGKGKGFPLTGHERPRG